MSQTLTRQALSRSVDKWIERDMQVAGPRQVKSDLVQYSTLRTAEDLVLDGYVRPANSIKEFFLPRHEVLYHYLLDGKRVELEDCQRPARRQVIVAARPCDAAALPILDKVFNWEHQDALYNARRENTTVVTLACTQHDDYCFCTSMGLGPDDPQGSDAILLAVDEDTFEVRCLSSKGEELFSEATERSERIAPAVPGPKPLLDMEQIKHYLASQFESPFWQTGGLRCLGCGACTYICPTCHCFDIVDEKNGAGGARVRNWDTCQAALYSQHASGHNPRAAQGHRQRNRIYHKFRTYPDKFGPWLCTGCGNCTRSCPVRLGVRPLLEALQEQAEAEQDEVSS